MRSKTCKTVCTFPSISSHRPIKIPKDLLFQSPSGGLMSFFQINFSICCCCCNAADKPAAAAAYPPNSCLRSAQNTDMLTKHRSAFGRQERHVLATVSGNSTWSKRIILCRLYHCWTESKFVMRNHSTAAVPGLIVSEVNFNCSSFVDNQGFSFL